MRRRALDMRFLQTHDPPRFLSPPANPVPSSHTRHGHHRSRPCLPAVVRHPPLHHPRLHQRRPQRPRRRRRPGLPGRRSCFAFICASALSSLHQIGSRTRKEHDAPFRYDYTRTLRFATFGFAMGAFTCLLFCAHSHPARRPLNRPLEPGAGEVSASAQPRLPARPGRGAGERARARQARRGRPALHGAYRRTPVPPRLAVPH
jgi:hypothetical protein